MSKCGKDENFIVYGCIVIWGEVLPKDAFDGYLLSCLTMCASAYGGEGSRLELLGCRSKISFASIMMEKRQNNGRISNS